MKVTIIGSGNVAAAFARAVSDAPGLTLGQICARNRERGEKLASLYGAMYASRPEEVSEADIYLIAVSDSAIGEVAARLGARPGSVVAHTCGGLPIDALGNAIPDRAVIYPLQTFSAGRDMDFTQIPLFIEYTTSHARTTASALASAVSERVMEADSNLRAMLHIAAVFAGNFTNHLYSIASDILKKEGLDFGVLGPLIREVTGKALESGDPASLQTGPAARGDEVTMTRHLAILERETEKKYSDIYKLLSKSIWETLKKT